MVVNTKPVRIAKILLTSLLVAAPAVALGLLVGTPLKEWRSRSV